MILLKFGDIIFDIWHNDFSTIWHRNSKLYVMSPTLTWTFPSHFFILRQPTDQLWSKLTFSDFHLPSAPVAQRSGYPAHVRNKRNWRLANRLKQVHPLLLIGLVTYRCWLIGVLRIDKNRAAWVKITVIEINFKKFDRFVNLNEI